MRYLKLTLQYISKNFFHLILIAIVPAVLLAITNNSSSIFDYIINYKTEAFISFKDIYLYISDNSPINLLINVFTFLSLAVALSLLCGITDKHMRMGISKVGDYLKRINNNFMNVLLVMLFFVLSYVVLGVLITIFGVLWTAIFGISTIALVFIIISAIVLSALLLLLFSLFILWLPTRVIKGLRSRYSIVDSLNASKSKFGHIFLAVLIPIVPLYILGCATFFVSPILNKIFDMLFYCISIIYYLVLMFVCYFDIHNIDREDLNKKTLEV